MVATNSRAPGRQVGFGPGAMERVELQAFQQRHALAQGAAEVDLAGHGASRDGCHLLADAGEGGELVQRLGGDDRAVHVGDQQPLAPVLCRGHGHVDRGVADQLAQVGRVGLGGAGDVGGLVRREFCDRAVQSGGDGVDERARELAGQGDEGEDEGHGGAHGRGRPVRQALIVAGPTCSGKSALALALAERLGGTVINADSMQVYRELQIVTARPSAEDEARVPHRLVWRPAGGGAGQRRVVAWGGARGDGEGVSADPVRRDRDVSAVAHGGDRRNP